MLKLTITYYKLDLNHVYVLARGNYVNAVLELGIPRQNIVNSDFLYSAQNQCYAEVRANPEISHTDYYEKFYYVSRLILNTVYTLLDDTISASQKIQYNCKDLKDYFFEVDFKAIKQGTATQYYEPYEQPTAIDSNLDFIFYTQHSMDMMFNNILHSKHCRRLFYVEEGTLNYLHHDEELFENHEFPLAKTEREFYQYSYPYLGIYRHEHFTKYQFKNSKNPNIDYDNSGFICLSELAFSKINIDNQWQNKLINRIVIDHVATHHIPKQQNPYYLQQKHIFETHPGIYNNENIQRVLKEPTNICNFVNIVVCENCLPHIISEQDYLEAHKTMIKEVINKGAFFFFIKFHPACDPKINQQLLDFLDNEALYTVIDHDVCLEKVFSESEKNTFIVHTITSSVGLYASKFLQLVFTYTDLYKDLKFYQSLRYIADFYLPDVIAYFNKENKTKLRYKRN